MQTEKYVVVDLETTGLFPSAHDRVIEIAVVSLADDATSQEEYVTLVNPGRDVGPTHIHGITARDVKHAPAFEEVAGDILGLIANSIVVGHNITFDLRFLKAEFARLGFSIPECPYLCTLALSRRLDPFIPRRNLPELCAYWGLEHGGPHSALLDAHATASVMRECVRRISASSLASLGGFVVNAHSRTASTWPTLPKTGKTLTRSFAAAAKHLQRSYIEQLISRLPPVTDARPEIQEYVSLLDRVIEDRRVSVAELNQLEALAHELGIDQQDAIHAHRHYLCDLICAALEDGIITGPEQKDIKDIRQLLGLSEDDYGQAFAEAQSATKVTPPTLLNEGKRPANLRGKTICFTGELQCRVHGDRATRAVAERTATEAGMIVKNGVTKTLDFLVVADPDTASGKARKAHEYGIRVIAEPVFWRMIGIAPA